MKNTFFKPILLLSFALSVSLFTACKKDKPATTETDTTIVETEDQSATTVEIATDDELTTNLVAATKDFPGVVATSTNGEITLNGEISRDRLAALMQSLHALNPKKINNNLIIK